MVEADHFSRRSGVSALVERIQGLHGNVVEKIAGGKCQHRPEGEGKAGSGIHGRQLWSGTGRMDAMVAATACAVGKNLPEPGLGLANGVNAGMIRQPHDYSPT